MNQQNLNNLVNKTVKKNSLKSRLKERFLKLKTYSLAHKKTSVAFGIILILIIYWLVKLLFPAGTVTSYAVAEVENLMITPELEELMRFVGISTKQSGTRALFAWTDAVNSTGGINNEKETD